MTAASNTPSRKIVDMRRKVPTKQPAPAAAPETRPAQPIATPGVMVPPASYGGLPVPLPVGRVVSLTDYEQKGLAALGVEGTPPAGLADFIAKLNVEYRDQLTERLPDAADPKRAPLAPPTEIDYATMPEAYKRQVQAFVAQARTLDAQQAALAAAIVPEAGQGINEALATALGAGPVERLKGTVQVTDDLPDRRQQQTPPPPQTAKEAPASPAAPAASPTDNDETGGLLPLKNCPHCNFDLSQPDLLEVSDDDKLAYLAAMLGGDRMRRRVSLLNGRLHVGFRSLLSKEKDTAFRQVACDTREGIRETLIPEQDELWGNLMSYLLVMGLEYIETSAHGRLEVPTLAEAALDEPPPGHTRLHSFYRAVVENFLKTDDLRSVVGAAFYAFQQTLGKLAANAHNESFWKAIAGQP